MRPRPGQQGVATGVAWVVVGFVLGFALDASLPLTLVAGVTLVAAWNVAFWLYRRRLRRPD